MIIICHHYLQFPTFKCVVVLVRSCWRHGWKQVYAPCCPAYPCRFTWRTEKLNGYGVTCTNHRPTGQTWPRYELVMRKFEDVLGPRSEALRSRCFHSLLTWAKGARVYEFWRFEVEESWLEMQSWDMVWCIYYRIVFLCMCGNWWLGSIVVFCVEYCVIGCTIGWFLDGWYMADIWLKESFVPSRNYWTDDQV